MTTTTSPAAATPAPVGSTPTPSPPRGRHESTVSRLTYVRVLRSEWIKLRTLRSTWVGLASVLLVMVAFGAIAAGVSTGSVTPGDGGGPPRTQSPLDTVLLGANFGVLLLGVIGCLAGAREYASRMITATMAAVPRRGAVVTAKAVVLGLLVLPVAAGGTLVAYATGTAILSSGGAATVALGDDGVLRAVVGTAVWLTAIALLGLALGLLLRSTAGSIGTLIGGVLILPGIAGALLPESWQTVLKLPAEQRGPVLHPAHPTHRRPLRRDGGRRRRRLARARPGRGGRRRAPARRLSDPPRACSRDTIGGLATT